MKQWNLKGLEENMEGFSKFIFTLGKVYLSKAQKPEGKVW